MRDRTCRSALSANSADKACLLSRLRETSLAKALVTRSSGVSQGKEKLLFFFFFPPQGGWRGEGLQTKAGQPAATSEAVDRQATIVQVRSRVRGPGAGRLDPCRHA